MAALDALDARHDAVARQRAIDEDDDAIMARDAAPTRCERVDGELELLSDPKRRSHAGSIGGEAAEPGPRSGTRAPRSGAAVQAERREDAEPRRRGRGEPQAAVALCIGERPSGTAATAPPPKSAVDISATAWPARAAPAISPAIR